MHKPLNFKDLEGTENPIWELYKYLVQTPPAVLVKTCGKTLPMLFEMCDASLGLGLFPKNNPKTISGKVLEANTLPPMNNRIEDVESVQSTGNTKGDTPTPLPRETAPEQTSGDMYKKNHPVD